MDIDDIYKQIGESGRQQIKYGMAMWIIKVDISDIQLLVVCK